MSKTPANMTPEEAQQWADMADDVPGYHDQPASRAYRTIANMTKEYRAVSKHPDSTLGIGPTTRSRWYPTRDEAIANRDPRVAETYSRLIGIEHRYTTQPEDSDG